MDSWHSQQADLVREQTGNVDNWSEERLYEHQTHSGSHRRRSDRSIACNRTGRELLHRYTDDTVRHSWLRLRTLYRTIDESCAIPLAHDDSGGGTTRREGESSRYFHNRREWSDSEFACGCKFQGRRIRSGRYSCDQG